MHYNSSKAFISMFRGQDSDAPLAVRFLLIGHPIHGLYGGSMEFKQVAALI